jgi:hypothetical protein
VAKWLRLQKRASLLILSFFVSSLYRSITGSWPFASQFGRVGSSTSGAKRGLLIPVGRNLFHPWRSDGSSRRYAFEFDSAFPYLHLQTLTRNSVPVALSSMACLSKAPARLGINAMQFGVGPEQSSGCGSANAMFSSNPVPPSTGIGNPPDISIGAPAPGGEAPSCGGCSGGGGGGCNCACNCDCGCNCVPDCACDCSCDNPGCMSGNCNGFCGPVGFTSAGFCDF